MGRPGWQCRPFAAGTLEQVYLSVLPSWLLAAAERVVAALAETLIVVAGIYGIGSIVVPLHCHRSAATLLPGALLIVTEVGYSLIIAAMALVERIQLLREGFLLLVMIFAISALPVLAGSPARAGVPRSPRPWPACTARSSPRHLYG